MERRCLNLLLAAALLPGAVAAQTQEEIADAITRLEGDREDARAIEFLIDAGEAAVGAMVEQLKAAPEDPDDPKFARLLRVLRAMGPEAAGACPGLGDLLCDPFFLKTHAGCAFLGDIATTLGQLAQFAPESAMETLEKFDASTLWRAREAMPVDVLSGFRVLRRLSLIEGPDRGGSVHGKLDALNPFEREFVVDLLGTPDRDNLPQLVALLGDSDQPTHTRVGTRLATLDQKTANSVVWDAASKAIARIDSDHPKAVRGLALMVESADDPRDRVKAAMALGRHGDAAAEHVDLLVKALDSHDDRLVAEAVTALGMIGVARDDILDRLRDLTSDSRPGIAERAEAALRALEQAPQVACGPATPGRHREPSDPHTGTRRGLGEVAVDGPLSDDDQDSLDRRAIRDALGDMNILAIQTP